MIIFEALDSGSYDYYNLLEYSTVKFVCEPTFRRKFHLNLQGTNSAEQETSVDKKQLVILLGNELESLVLPVNLVISIIFILNTLSVSIKQRNKIKCSFTGHCVVYMYW
jgi:hypothetical protein